MANYIFGINSIMSALESGKKIFHVYHSKNNFKLNKKFDERRIKMTFKKNDELREMTGTDKHQGYVAEVEPFKYTSLNEVLQQKPKGNRFLFVMLDGIEDPHNFGAIVRTAECAGADAIIIGKNRQVQVTPTVHKVSTGAVDLIPIVLVSNINNAISELKKNNIWIVCSDMDGQDYRQIDFDMNTCLVIGSEGTGVSSLVRKNSDFIASLPMIGKTSSLNASVSAAILIYKAKEVL